MALADVAKKLQQAQQGFARDASGIVGESDVLKGQRIRRAGKAAQGLQQGIEGRYGALSDVFSKVGQNINTNTQQGAEDVRNDFSNILAASQRTPLDINQGAKLSPAVQGRATQLGNQAASQMQGQGAQLQRELGSRQNEASMVNEQQLSEVQNWKREKELEALAQYQDIRRALHTEVAGSNLEMRLALAQLAANALQEDLNTINGIAGM